MKFVFHLLFAIAPFAVAAEIPCASNEQLMYRQASATSKPEQSCEIVPSHIALPKAGRHLLCVGKTSSSDPFEQCNSVTEKKLEQEIANWVEPVVTTSTSSTSGDGRTTASCNNNFDPAKTWSGITWINDKINELRESPQNSINWIKGIETSTWITASVSTATVIAAAYLAHAIVTQLRINQARINTRA